MKHTWGVELYTHTFLTRPFYSRGNNPSTWRLGGLQSWSGRFGDDKSHFPLTEIDTRFAQPLPLYKLNRNGSQRQAVFCESFAVKQTTVGTDRLTTVRPHGTSTHTQPQIFPSISSSQAATALWKPPVNRFIDEWLNHSYRTLYMSGPLVDCVMQRATTQKKNPFHKL
jgi:hypothetical protein